MLNVPVTTLADGYTAANTFGGLNGEPLVSGSLTVANFPAIFQLFYGIQGQGQTSPEVYIAPTSFPVSSLLGRAIRGFRARNAVAGSNAVIFGSLFTPQDPNFGSGTPFTSTVTPGGGVVPAAVQIPRVNALPASPVDSQIIEYVDAGSGSDWLLIYSSSLGAWVWQGGENYAAVDTDESTTTTGSYVDLATPGPSLTVPLSGDYLIEAGSRGYNSLNAGQTLDTSIQIAGGVTLDADAFGNTASTSALQGIGASRKYRKTLSATNVLKLQYKTGVNPAHWLDRWISLHPITVHS